METTARGALTWYRIARLKYHRRVGVRWYVLCKRCRTPTVRPTEKENAPTKLGPYLRAADSSATPRPDARQKMLAFHLLARRTSLARAGTRRRLRLPQKKIGMIRMATMLTTLIIGLCAGPAVSL